LAFTNTGYLLARFSVSGNSKSNFLSRQNKRWMQYDDNQARSDLIRAAKSMTTLKNPMTTCILYEPHFWKKLPPGHNGNLLKRARFEDKRMTMMMSLPMGISESVRNMPSYGYLSRPIVIGLTLTFLYPGQETYIPAPGRINISNRLKPRNIRHS
jgi:hypothetical protein